MKKKYPKGSCGYVKAEKLRRFIFTAILFAIPLIIFFSGWYYNGTRKNVLTVVAILGCLPACKFLVSFIMIAMIKPMDQTVYKKIKKASQGITMAYELLFTTYEENTFVDAVAICGNHVICYSSRLKDNGQKLEKHVTSMMRNVGFSLQVKVIGKLDVYLDRLHYLKSNQEELHKNIKYTPDPDDADSSREEVILRHLLALAL